MLFTARICVQIFMTFEILAHKIVIDRSIKFLEDLSFRCGDICTNARAQVINAGTRDKTCARICAQIFMKCETKAHKK